MTGETDQHCLNTLLQIVLALILLLFIREVMKLLLGDGWGFVGNLNQFNIYQRRLWKEIEDMVDEMAQIDDSSHKSVQRGGLLRPSLHAGFAAQIMYYEDRNKSGMFVNLVVHSILFCMYLIKKIKCLQENCKKCALD